MKLKYGLLILCGFIVLASCGKYDDTPLWNKVNSLEKRISDIEKQIEVLNKDLSDLGILAQALSGRLTMTGYTKADGTFTIYFSDGSHYTVSDGKNGQVPYVGSNGNWWIGDTDTKIAAGGKDGSLPYVGSNGNWWIGNVDSGIKAYLEAFVGIREENSTYWWTLTVGEKTSWITDASGNRIPATGENGKSAKLRVNGDGFWEFSTDGGSHWTLLTDGTGAPVTVSCLCQVWFSSVSFEDNVLTMVLPDGTVIRVDFDAMKDIRLDSVISPEIQEELAQWIPLHTGNRPPDISGCFRVVSPDIVYMTESSRSVSPAPSSGDFIVRFSNPDSERATIDFDGIYLSSECEDLAWGRNVFICGHKDKFTVYFKEDEDIFVISGIRTDSGLSDVRYAMVVDDEAMVLSGKDESCAPSQWPLGTEPEMVDLGLPSGLLWASHNVGASSREGYPMYQAWGEQYVFSKTVYDWSSYKYSSPADEVDDVVSVLYGQKWHTPDITDFVELMDHTTRVWQKVNGVYGYMLTSIHNGKTLFLPAGGGLEVSTALSQGTAGVYWSSDLYDDNASMALGIVFDSSKLVWSPLSRCYGYQIRGVYGESAAVRVSSVSLSESELTLRVGESISLTAEVLPSSATNKMVYWNTTDSGIAGVSQEGVVSAVAMGQCSIRVKTLDGAKTAWCNIKVLPAAPQEGGTEDFEYDDWN